MKGEILQSATVFNPYTIPEYRYAELEWFRANAVRALNPNLQKRFIGSSRSKLAIPIHPSFQPKTLKEWQKIISGEYLGALVYPKAVEHLKPLGITSISNLKSDKEDVRIPSRIKDINDFQRRISEFNRLFPEFDAKVKPTIPIGANTLHVEMSSRKLTHTRVSDENGRNIRLSAVFTSPSRSRLGLRELRSIYPEMEFNESMKAIELPKDVSSLYEQFRSYNSLYYNLEKGNVDLPKPKDEYSEETYLSLLKTAWRAHLSYLRRPIRDLNLNIRIGEYEKSDPNTLMSTQRYIVLRNIDDVIDLVSDPSYIDLNLPRVSADFGDQMFDLDFTLPHGWKDFNIGPYDRAMTVYNKNDASILEDLLEKVITTSL